MGEMNGPFLILPTSGYIQPIWFPLEFPTSMGINVQDIQSGIDYANYEEKSFKNE